MTNIQQGLRDGRLVALIERLEVVDAFYGITPEERSVLDVIHGLNDVDLEAEEE